MHTPGCCFRLIQAVASECYRSVTNFLLLMDTFLCSRDLPKCFTLDDGFDDAVPDSVRFACRVFLYNWFSKPSQFEVADAQLY